MPLTFPCPECQRTLRLPDEYLGRTVRCPSCKATFGASAEVVGQQPPAVVGETEEPRPKPSRPVGRPRPPADPVVEIDDEADYEDEPDEGAVQERARPRRRGRRSQFRDAALAQLTGPAISLMVMGCLVIVSGVLGLVMNLAFAPNQMAGNQPQMFQPKGRFQGQGAVPPVMPQNPAFFQPMQLPTWAYFAGAGWNLLYGSILLLGGIQMRTLNSYGSAMSAAIFALIPCNGCCILTIPFGIWALIVLMRPDVKDAFG